MKYWLFLGVIATALLSACAPTSTNGQGDFPVNRKVRWVLVNGDTKSQRNFYWIQFDTGTPDRRDEVNVVRARAQRFGGGGTFNAVFGHIIDSDSMLTHIFLERDFDGDANAVNCFLIRNEDKGVGQLKPTDWFGLGKQDTPKNFAGKLDFKDRGYFDTCVLFDATEYTTPEPNSPINKALRAEILDRAEALPSITW